jgi:integrase
MNRRGFGSIYKRGSTWWIRYSHHGHEFRESSGSDDERVAFKLLKQRLRQTGGTHFVGPAEERLKFDDLAEMLLTDYEVNGRRSLDKLNCRMKHLSSYFGLVRAVDITADRVQHYVVERQQEGAKSATINRELAALKRAFALAVKASKLGYAPHIALLEEQNARQGFVDHDQFLPLREQLPEHLRDPISFLYLSGWRVSEMRLLEWKDVDLSGRIVRLRPELSKNKRGRVLPLMGELAEIIDRARAERRLDCPFVFHRSSRPLKDFRSAWLAACKKAGLSPLLVHDLRRTAVRNFVRAGISEKVAMELTGHKTRSVFDRYNIVSESDLRSAVDRVGQYLDKRPLQQTVIPLKNVS